MLPRWTLQLPGFDGGCGLSGSRKSQSKNRASISFVAALDVSLVVLNNSVRRTQAQPRTLSHRFRSVEGIEHTLGIRNARPGVGEFDHHFTPDVPRRYQQRSPTYFRKRINRVFAQVKKCLQQLMAIAPDAWQAGLQNRFDSNVPPANLHIMHLQCALHQRTHVDQNFLGWALL
jgi:hypothetical protein